MNLIDRVGLIALSYHSYRKFFAAQLFLISAFMMQQTAISWEIYSLSESSFVVGALLCLFNVGLFIFTPISGVLSNQFDKKKLTKNAYLIVCLGTLIFALKAQLNLNLILAVIFNQLVYGIAIGFEMPIRWIWISDIISEKEQLASAIGLNQFASNSSRVLGPILAGSISFYWTIDATYYFTVVFNLIAFYAIFSIKIKRKLTKTKKKIKEIPKGFAEGLSYIKATPEIKSLMLLSLVVSFSSFGYSALMPEFIKSVIGGNSNDLGNVIASSGAGAMVASLIIASMKKLYLLHRYLMLAIIIFIAVYSTLFFIQALTPTYVLLFCIGFGQVMYYGSCQNIVHNSVPREYLGRVISLFLMCNMFFFTTGNMLIGKIADAYSISEAFKFQIIGSLVSLLLFILFRLKIKAIIPIIKTT